ncbi:MAG: aminoacyltransferase [Peptococcaceae bacterium]|nr:aminoacyltransferase [Peptococcaceae bacterium]
MRYTACWLNDEARDRDRFNAFVAGHAKGHVMQLWQWGDIKGRTGWKPWRLVITEEAGKDESLSQGVNEGGSPSLLLNLEPRTGELASMTVLERRLPLVGAPIFYAPRGPVADVHDADLLDAVWAAVRGKAKERGAILLKVDPDVSAEDAVLMGLLKEAGFKRLETGKNFEGIQPRFVFRLDIREPEEALLGAMHQKTRYNIRLAQKRGVRIRRGTREDLPVFYEVLKETTERDNFMVRSLAYFEDMFDSLQPAGYAELFIAEYEGRVVAGTFAMTAGDKAWYVYGASSNADRNVMPNYLIQWEMIRWAKGLGCAMYDFRGVSGDLNEDNPLYGLYKFKKGFNGVFTEFVGEWDVVYRPAMYRVWRLAEKVYSGGVKKVLAKLRVMVSARKG